MAGLDLAPGVEAGSAGDVRTGAVVGPRGAGEALADGDVHERVPRRVELHLVEAVAVAVVGAQLGLVPVRLLTPPLRLLGAGEAADAVQVVEVPARSLALHAGEEHRVRSDVVADPRRHLVDDVVGGGARRGVDRGHALIVAADRPRVLRMEQLRVPVGDDLVLDAVVDGAPDGQVVLLLHGFPQNATSWRDVRPALVEAGFRVVAPDQRGYSPDARPVGVEHYRMASLVADALAVLDAVGADTAHVVGHDWGAAVAWHLTGRHADRVRTLTAVSVPHPLAFVQALRTDADQRARSQYMRDWHDPATEEQLLADGFAHVFADAPGVDAAPYVDRMREPGALTAALSWYRAQSLDDLQGLGPITVPTMHVWSDGDAALGPAGARLTAAQVEGPYRFEVLHGISHWVPEQAPAELSRLLLEHLR